MPQSNRLDVDVYPNDGLDGDPIKFKDIHYISYVTGSTYALPAVITESKYKDEGLPLRVLYINPANVVAVDATRRA
jgi:hypothetical protein